MLSDSEWVEIYRHLLQKLRDIADNSLILDVERAASARIEENLSEDSEIITQFSRESREDLAPERAASARIEENLSEDSEIITQSSRESREDLAPIRLRAPTPREAFTAAIGVLITRVREVPVLADRVASKFDCDATNIQWYPDVSERDQVSERGSFSAFDFKLEGREREQIESVLKRLENLLEDQ